MVEQVDSNVDEPNVHESTVDYDRTKMLDSIVELCADHNYIASCILSLIKSAYKVRVQVNSGLYDKFYCHNNETVYYYNYKTQEVFLHNQAFNSEDDYIFINLARIEPDGTPYFEFDSTQVRMGYFGYTWFRLKEKFYYRRKFGG